MNCREALRQVLFLKTVPEAALSALVEAGRERKLDRGELLFPELARSLGLIVILQGAVKICKVDSRGRELTLSIEMAGGCVGELPLFDGGNYPYSAEAAAEDTSVWIVPRTDFVVVMRQYPEIAQRGLLALGVSLRRMIQIVEAQSLHPVRARLARYLYELSQGSEVFRLPQTNEDIANQLGTVREVVSRTLSGLKASHVIALQGRQVTVKDPEELKRIAG
jgi:CRP-like cAMP-binding protein